MANPNYSQQQKQYLNNQQNNETLLAMRKHNSLDNDQFLLTTHHLSPSNFSSLSIPPSTFANNNFGGLLDNSNSQNNNYYNNNNKNWNQQQKYYNNPQQSLFNSKEEENDNIYWCTFQPISAQSFLNEYDARILQKELLTICEHYNNLISSIHSFWVPKLQIEKTQKEEEKIKAENLERQMVQLESELNILRASSSKNYDDNIGVIKSHSSTNLRDFTDHSITLNEWKTLKAKLEQSELCLSECTRELQNVELRAKCLEEEKKEVEKRNEILTHCNTNNEEQLKLINEDLNVLRGKLELKNQLIENKEKEIKKFEKEKEELKFELNQDKKCVNEAEHRSSQLLHKIDIMERLQQEKDAQIEQLKQRILQQPGSRAEKQLEEKVQNMIEERHKFEQMFEQIQKQNDCERQQQLEMFILEREQLQLDLIYLKKELADRHMLIGSQSEKISQNFNIHNNNLKNKNKEEINKKEEEGNYLNLNKLEQKHHKEIECLLGRIGQLEREKSKLIEAVKSCGGDITRINGTSEQQFVDNKFAFLSLEESCEDDLLMINNKDERIVSSFKQRIFDLEEALKESVECTSEKEKELNEQKRICEKLSEQQIGQLFESNNKCEGRGEEENFNKNDSKQLVVEEAQKQQLEEERQFRQKQISSLRKEFGMALIAEKEFAISLILNNLCPLLSSINDDSTTIPQHFYEKLEILQKQKEAILHSLSLIDNNETFEEGKIIHQKKVGHANTKMPLIQPGRPISSLSSFSTKLNISSQYSQPIRIQTNNGFLYNNNNQNNELFVMSSAPATFNNNNNFEELNNNQMLDEEGIWA